MSVRNEKIPSPNSPPSTHFSSHLRTPNNGFTLVELLISIVITTIIGGAVYFAVSGALDSWSFCRDQLSLQKVLTETMDRVIAGSAKTYGLKDSLEIISAGRTKMEFIPPWVDDTHASAGRDFIYTLNRRLKPGAPVPIGEVRVAEATQWKLVPITVIPLEDNDQTQAKLNLTAPEGSELRFVYHPDWKTEPDTVHGIFWDKKTREIMMEVGDKIESISKNLFGVEILDVRFTYYMSNNDLVTDREWVDDADLQIITGVRVEIEARLGEQTRKLDRFVNLRNSPMRTGYLTLKPNAKIPIPDSKTVKTLMLTNLSGIGNNDVLQLEMLGSGQTAMRVTITFGRLGSARPTIDHIEVEYPPQKTVYSESPHVTADLGVNLTLLGSDGVFDYDDDEDVDDVVHFEGDVILYVNEMSIEGAGLFVKP